MPARDVTTTLSAKVAFLATPQAYRPRPEAVVSRQTHMSWVFLTADRAVKLKKPVRFPFLDYSTLDRREAACRAEVAVNRRLAPAVYLDVMPLVSTVEGLSIGGAGEIVDWLVVMQRLAEESMLDRALAAGTLAPAVLERLAGFYRRAAPVALAPAAHLAGWRRRIIENKRVLSAPGQGLDPQLVAAVHRAQERFLCLFADVVGGRARDRRIVDGHGDLRPEHIHVGEPLAVIDRIKFSRAFRTVDPCDELAFLYVECALLGAPEVGRRIAARAARALADQPPPVLFSFYASCRAAMRARLMIAHLAEPDGHSLDRWRGRARDYLAIAAQHSTCLDRASEARRRRPARHIARV